MSIYAAEVDPFAPPAAQPVAKPARKRRLRVVKDVARPPLTRADVSLEHLIFVPRDLLVHHARDREGVMDGKTYGPVFPISLEMVTTVVSAYALGWWDKPVHAGDPGSTITGTGHSVADRLGWARQPESLRAHLLDPTVGGTGLLTPWMTLAANESGDHPSVDDYWTVHVRPVDLEGKERFVKVPLWWLFAPREDLTDSHARHRRGLLRCACGTWLTDPKPWRRDDLALLGALMVIEPEDWDEGVAEVALSYLAKRWGRSKVGVNDALQAAKRRGYVTASSIRADGEETVAVGGRRGDKGIPAIRRVVTDPTVALVRHGGTAIPGCPRCPRWRS